MQRSCSQDVSPPVTPKNKHEEMMKELLEERTRKRSEPVSGMWSLSSASPCFCCACRASLLLRLLSLDVNIVEDFECGSSLDNLARPFGPPNSSLPLLRSSMAGDARCGSWAANKGLACSCYHSWAYPFSQFLLVVGEYFRWLTRGKRLALVSCFLASKARCVPNLAVSQRSV